MRDFPSCFGENGVRVTDASCSSVSAVTKSPQNSVTSVYQCRLFGKSCLITLTWGKGLMGQSLSVEINDMSRKCLCRVEVKPCLFSKWKGSKCLLEVTNSGKIDLYWDLSVAKFGSCPEPLEGYYVAVLCNGEMVLVIGDKKKEALSKACGNGKLSLSSNAMCLCKKEHVFGKNKVYGTRLQLSEDGEVHALEIECDTAGTRDPSLAIRVDGRLVMKVKNLRWKFRGNYSVLVDGFPLDIFWDVFNWLFGGGFGSAVFMFQACLSAEKLWAREAGCDPSAPWPRAESWKDSESPGLGFSLVLYAWKNE